MFSDGELQSSERKKEKIKSGSQETGLRGSRGAEHSIKFWKGRRGKGKEGKRGGMPRFGVDKNA